MRTPVLLGLLLLAAACGSRPDRPEVVATDPANMAVVPITVQSFSVTFDEPVTLLQPLALRAWLNGAELNLDVWVDPNSPSTVNAQPAGGASIGVGWVSVQVGPSLLVNPEGQYRLDDYWFGYTVAVGGALHRLLADPARVVEIDPATDEIRRVVAPPEGGVPLAQVTSLATGEARVWVQLEDGGGAGEALASFGVGDGAMRPLALAFVPGGDLVATHAALALAPDGRTLYAAYRDEAGLGIRVSRVDTARGVETGTLLLSMSPSRETWPRGLTIPAGGAGIQVAWAADGVTGTTVVKAADLPPIR